MIARMFSFTPLPLDVRGTFELPAWPYAKSDADFKLFKDYLTNLGIFWYEDTDADAPRATKIFTFETVQELPDLFNAYRYRVVLDDDTFKVMTWPEGYRRDEAKEGWTVQSDYYGDEFAWEEFNLAGEVSYLVQGKAINFRLMEEFLANPLDSNCFKKN